MPMTETDVLRMLLARTNNYAISGIERLHGRIYTLTMDGRQYNAVLLISSFDYYRLRFHIALDKPSLVICYNHDTVLPIDVLSMRAGNIARPYELPEGIDDVLALRHTQVGSQVLLGMYISGMKRAQELVNTLPVSTRNRYLHRAKMLARRKRGRPVTV